MSSTNSLPNASPQALPDPEELALAVERLQLEHDATDSATGRAILLHEIALLQQVMGDEGAALQTELSATNEDPDFGESLEHLIRLVEERRSYKNLALLLERLVELGEGSDERCRALLEQAAFSLLREPDLPRAQQLIEQVTDTSPDNPVGWLALELLACKLSDPQLRVRALAARASLAQPPYWRSLLLIDLARLQYGTGDADSAYASLEEARSIGGAAAFAVERALEDLAQRDDRADFLARALEAQARLILAALDSAETGDVAGVPHWRRTRAHAADAWMRAAEALRGRGEIGPAILLLDQALERLPDEQGLFHARIRLAELTGDVTTAARLARAELASGATGGVAAALWLRVAEAAAAEGDALTALESVGRALVQDPGCIPARTLRLDLLSGGYDPQALATALEGTADQLPSDAGKARFFLLAADSWARQCGDTAGAKAALSQAAMCGGPPPLLARVARMLSALIADHGWYEEATRRLLATSGASSGQADLWFELGRIRLLRGELQGADAAFESLSGVGSGAWLGRLLRTYVTDLRRDPNEPSDSAQELNALRILAQTEQDPAVVRALRLTMAWRMIGGARLDDAISELEQLRRDDPSDTVVSVALATLAMAKDDHAMSADVLATAALASNDPATTSALNLEAGVRYWRAGKRQRAVECFGTANGKSSGAANVLLGWALRAAEPNDADARRRALAVAGDGPDHDAINLERFALELGGDADDGDARTALDAIGHFAHPDLALAALLARTLWSPRTSDPETRAAALDQLGQFGGTATVLARSALHQLLLEDGANSFDPARLERAAAGWVEADPDNLSAVLEWLGASVAAADVEHEVEARQRLGALLGGDLGLTITAGASVLAALSKDEPGPLLDSKNPASSLANLELALPGANPARRARALLGVGSALGDENLPLLRALAGWNQLAAGDVSGAMQSFRQVVESSPMEVTAWEGLRAAAETAGNRAAVAEACGALGDAVADAAQGAEFWERAATILIDELGDHERGEYALSRAVERDVSRFSSFDRLFRIVRSRKDGPRLLDLVSARLEVVESSDEIVKLYWERARVLRAAGDKDEALQALENVTMLEPDHVGALALKGEIYITSRDFASAAANLARLSKLSEAPAKQRLMSGVAAVDLYENKLGDVPRALEVLVALYRSDLSTLPVRERLARLAARVEAWTEAIDVLEKLMHERDTREGRIDAARLSMVIRRDRLKDPAGAGGAVRRLLTEAPGDPEAVDLLLSGAFRDSESATLLERARPSLVGHVVADPMDATGVNRLSRVAARLGDAPLRQATLGVLVALGSGSPEIDRELAQLDQRVAHVPQIVIDEKALPELCDPEDRGPLPELLRALAQTLAEAIGPSREALGVTKKDRVDPRAGLPIRNEIVAWAGALGIADFELYVGGRDPDAVTAVATELPAVVVGTGVRAPLSARHRQALARELFALRRGTTILRHRDASDIAALIVATSRLAGYEVSAPHYAMLAEFQRQLSKFMSRKLKKVLPELVRPALESQQNLEAWVKAAVSSLDRMAAIAVGDVSHVLSGNPSERGRIAASGEARERAIRLLSFVLSPSYLTLRTQLGMGVR